jgi:hypothetical protein
MHKSMFNLVTYKTKAFKLHDMKLKQELSFTWKVMKRKYI